MLDCNKQFGMLFWIFGTVLLVFLLYFLVKDLYLFYVKQFPRGPLSIPLLGNLHLLSMKTPHLDMENVVNKYGKIFSFRLGPMGRMVFLQDINHINQLFESPYAHNRPDMPIFDKLNNGVSGIGSCGYDQRWKLMTKTLHKGMAKMSTTCVQRVAMSAFTQLFERFSSRATSKDWYSPRSDVIYACSAMFSSFVYGIEPENLDSEELKTRIGYHSMVMSVLNPAHPFNLFPSLWLLPLPLKKKLLKCLAERDQLFQTSFDKHVENFNGDINDVLDIIAEFEQKNDHTDCNVTRKDMFLSAWTLYMAGCDTVTDTTLWILLYLCVYTDVQDKMQQEIDRVITSEEFNILENKSNLHYTRAAILESMRLASPVALGLPSELTEDMYIGSYTIPKGTSVMPNQWHVHHDPEHWPEPFSFKPERFLDKNGELLSTYYIFQKMPFIPFSRGKRPCIGQYLALDLLLICFTSMLKKFTVRLPPGYEPDLTGNVLFNLRPDNYPIECFQR